MVAKRQARHDFTLAVSPTHGVLCVYGIASPCLPASAKPNGCHGCDCLPIETRRPRERSCDWAIATRDTRVTCDREDGHTVSSSDARSRAPPLASSVDANAQARVLSASHRSYSSKRVPAAPECLNIPSADRVVALAGQCWRGTIETMPPLRNGTTRLAGILCRLFVSPWYAWMSAAREKMRAARA